MKKSYLKLSIVFMILLIGGLGCNKTPSSSDSGLASITLTANSIGGAIDKKITNPPEGWTAENIAGLQTAGFALVISAYNKSDNQLDFSCVVPSGNPGETDKSKTNCVISDNTPKTDLPPNPIPSGTPPDMSGKPNPPKGKPELPFPPPDGNKTPPAKTDALKPFDKTLDASNGKYKLVEQKIVQKQEGNIELSKVSIKYDDQHDYYGYLVFYCKTDKKTDSNICIKNKVSGKDDANKAKYNHDTKKLELPIPLQWTKSFGGKEGSDDNDPAEFSAEGTAQVSGEVSVEIKATIDEEEPATTESGKTTDTENK